MFNVKYLACTTIEEFFDESKNDASKRAYNLKSIKIESADGRLGNNSSSPMSDTDSIISISDLYSLVKTYDKDFSSGKTTDHLRSRLSRSGETSAKIIRL